VTDTAVRRAIAADVPALHALAQRAYRGDAARGGWTHEADLVEGERIASAELARIVDDRNERLLVASGDDGALIGCVRVTDEGAGTALLGLLAVDPSLQAGGLGRRLIAAAEDAARTDFGAQVMEMTVISNRAELIAYYERRGYAPTGQTKAFIVETDPPLSMILMAKAL
jgi:predicted N-acetyltransferase YhbS